jgi:hypothetical protein
MNVAINDAWMKAVADSGLAYRWAHLSNGDRVDFVGRRWEDGGFLTDADGNPTTCGNEAVLLFDVEPLDPKSAIHRHCLAEWLGR